MRKRIEKKNYVLPALSVLCLSITSVITHAGNEEFNTDFLQDVTDQISIDAVKNGYAISPGIYKFAIRINNENLDSQNIRFYKNNENEVVPCLDQNFIEHNQIIFASAEQKKLDAEGCHDFSVIPNATLKFDVGTQKLDLSLSQVNLIKVPRGYVSPKLFNEGINAFILNYTANTNFAKTKQGDDRQNTSVFLNGGFNFGPWRYRNQSSFSQNSGESHQWQNSSNKLERNIISMQARLELGDSYSNNDVFDSVNFRGVQFSKDTAQLPMSMQNYAPVIRGTAFTNAVVDVKQNGYLVYSTNVAPGQFVIDDLYAANESGDLEVTIKESDGRVEKFTQPYSSVPNMIRPGQNKYQITAGQFRNGSHNAYHPYFGQFSYARGFNNYLTPYTGAIVAEDYYALATGLAWTLGRLGSFSTDVTYAENTLATGEKKDGASFRFLYAKSLNQIGTNFRLVGYRYSTEGYYSLADAAQEKSQWQNGVYKYTESTTTNDAFDNQITQTQSYYSTTFYNKKNQSQVSLNQDLGKWGQLYCNLTKTDYWQKNYDSESWQIGYNNSFKRMNYGAYYQQEKSLFSGSHYTAGITMSFTFDQPKLLRSHDVTSNSAYRYSDQSGATVQTSLSGSFLEDKNLNLQLQVANAESGNNSFGMSSNYRGSKVNSNLSYTYDDHYQQVSAGVNGGILLHSGGILFGQQMNSNPILVEAKGAKGVRIENQPGLKIDQSGYAIISGSSAYIKNRVALRTEDLGQNISVENAVINDIVPTKMAIVKVKFDVKSGQSILVNLSHKDKAVVTGATILDAQTQMNAGMVGLNGQAYLAAVESNQTLIAKWGEDDFQQCQFKLPELKPNQFGYDEISLQCHPIGESENVSSK